MGTRTLSNYQDLITFTRASSGYALRPVTFGTTLVTNGSGESVNDWDSPRSNSTLSVNSGRLRSTATAAGAYGIAQTLTGLTVGGLYHYSANVYADGGSGDMIFRISALSTLDNTPVSDEQSTTRLVSGTFLATASTMYVGGIHVAAAGGDYIELDNVEIKTVSLDTADGTLTLLPHPNDVPRVEWDADRNRLGLLVEESRTNLSLYSDFSLAPNTRANTTVADADPILGLKALKVTTDSGDSNDGLIYAAGTSFTTGVTYTISAFARIPEGKTARIQNTAGIAVSVDSDGTVFYTSVYSRFAGATLTTKVVPYGNNIFRMTATATATDTGSGALWLGPSSAADAGDSCDIAGWMTEVGAFPTSYIKTTGATATRSADVASIPVADFGYNQSEGTVFIEIADKNGGVLSALGDGTFTNDLRFGVAGSNVARGTGSGFTNIVQVGTYVGGLKIAVRIDEDNYQSSEDGNISSIDTSASLPPNPESILIGRDYGAYINGHIKSIKYYPRALTAAQLQEITS